MGIADSYGIELVHPIREGRSEAQIGKKGAKQVLIRAARRRGMGKSNYRWIVGGKQGAKHLPVTAVRRHRICFLLNQKGKVAGWEAATANVHDSAFHPLIKQFDGRMAVLTDKVRSPFL